MQDMHPNDRLRKFSTVGLHGKARTTVSDIACLTDTEYAVLRDKVRANILKGKDDLSAKKHAREVLRRISLARKKGMGLYKADTAPFEKKASILLDALNISRNTKNGWKPYNQRKKPKEIDLRVFSFIDAPEETLDKFIAIAVAESESKEIRLRFSDSVCYDMGPYLVLSLLRNDIPSRLLRRGSITPDITEVLNSVGLLDALKIIPRDMDYHKLRPANDSTLSKSKKPDNYYIMPFPLRSGGGITPEELATSEQRDAKVANEFVESLKEWVRQHNPKQTISSEIESEIKSVITEILDNAHRHGEPDTEKGKWHIVGVLQKLQDSCGRAVVVCNLSIINLGLSIADTIKKAPQSVLDEVNAYTNKHKSFFDVDTLQTVCALQDRVSRIHPNPSGAAKLNGIGLMTTIFTIFNPLFSSPLEEYQPSLTILSGTAWIRASAPYNEIHGDYGKRKLAFNKENDINYPPDSACVKTLKKCFPGTIISMRFVIGADKFERLLI